MEKTLKGEKDKVETKKEKGVITKTEEEEANKQKQLKLMAQKQDE